MAMMAMENQQPVVQMQLIQAPSSRPPLPPPPPAPQAYKHHCKVCKKGFMCGRALGGHMRAHGIGDDGLSADDTLDDDSAPYGGGGAGESSETRSPSTTIKRMYALRTNPGRPRNCRVCENCGKEFTSWKSLLDHGRCNFDEDDDLDVSLRSSPLPDADDGEEEEEEDLALAAGWSKGKRSRRAKVMAVGSGSITELQLPSPSSEEEDLANCLVMLSSSRAAQPFVVDADQESCASASKDEAEQNRFLVPQPISMVAPAAAQMMVLAPQMVPQHVPTVPRGIFECKACKKVFTSHQALGGHRASHKKVKGCYAAKLESNRSETHQQPVAAASHDNIKAIADTNADAKTTSVSANADSKTMIVGAGEVVMATAAPEMVVMPVDDVAPEPYAVSPFKKKGKVHECSVCHRVFASGQALGGHKRCHWLTSSATDPAGAGAVAKLQPVAPDHDMAAMCHQLTLGRPMHDTADQRILDLNVPANPSAEARTVAARQAAELNDSPLCLNAPASVYMQSWTGHSNASHVNKTPTNSRNDAAAGGGAATEDEADSTSAKKAKISDLKDMNVAGESLPWLQVGIGFSSSESKKKSTQE